MTGLVLAGGLSSRFGQDKSCITLHDAQQDMVDFSLSLLSQLPEITDLVISCRPEQKNAMAQKRVSVICDEKNEVPTPLNGLIAVLRRRRSPVFAIPCDLPLMTGNVLSLLMEAREKKRLSQHRVLLRTTFIDEKGFLEPTIGIYEPESLPFLEEALAQKKLGLWSAIPHEQNCLVPRPGGPAFLNMNTQEDFDLARRLIARISPAE